MLLVKDLSAFLSFNGLSKLHQSHQCSGDLACILLQISSDHRGSPLLIFVRAKVVQHLILKLPRDSSTAS